MSYLAIGAVTRSLVTLLERKMNQPPLLGLTTFRVSCLPPDDDRVGEENGVNLFLYRVMEHPHLKNLEWRGDRVRRANGRPPLALTLHYLLTAFARRSAAGVQDDIAAHHLFGNAMAVLHDFPVLNDVHDGDFDASLDTHFAPELRNAFEKVKTTMQPVTLEEFSKIWTGLSKAYRLSAAYEVSLVQIAPVTPSQEEGPPPSTIGLDVVTIGPPLTVSLTPATGPAGTLVTLRGGRFLLRPPGATVIAGGVRIDPGDVERMSNDEIVFRMPGDVRRGPRLTVAAEANGEQSAPQFFAMDPWIERLRPARGMAGIPVEFSTVLVPGTAITVEAGGAAVPGAALSADGRIVQLTIPATLTSNGPLPLTLLAGPAPGARSNSLMFEVLPRLTSVTVTATAPPVVTTVAVTGERLAGRDVFIQYDNLQIRVGENANPAAAQAQIDRALPANHRLSVMVDGRESNVLPPQLQDVTPAAAFRGDQVTLRGRGLSGQAVSVLFGGTPVALGGHGIASRVVVTVPAGLPAGPAAIVVRVDGHDSTAIPFEVRN